MMLIIFYGSAKRLEKIFSPYGPIYSRKSIQLIQLMAYRYKVLSVARQHQTLLLLGGIPLPFDQHTKIQEKRC